MAMNKCFVASIFSTCLFVLSVISAPCAAAIYKCKNGSGSIAYNDKPCVISRTQSGNEAPHEEVFATSHKEKIRIKKERFEKHIEANINRWNTHKINYRKYEAKMPNAVSKALVDIIATRFKECREATERESIPMPTKEDLDKAEAHYQNAVDIFNHSEQNKIVNV